RSFHQPSGRLPTTLAASTTSTVPITLGPESLEELGEVLGKLEVGRSGLVVDALRAAERIAARRRLLRCGLLLLSGLRGVARGALALALLGLLLLLGRLAAGQARHAGHPGDAAALGHLLHHLARLE